MLKNFLKIAFRNIWKHKAFSFINILGLSIGLSASFVIGALIYYDATFDTFHKDKDHIYRVTTSFKSPEGDFYNYGVAVPVAEALRNQSGDIALVSSFFTPYIDKVEEEEHHISFTGVEDAVYVDQHYFNLFQYTWLVGNPDNALQNPNEVVLTKERANTYFPHLKAEDIVGRTLTYNDSIVVKVSGIVADIKERSDLYFKEFLSLETARQTADEDMVFSDGWNDTNSASQIFLKISPTGSATRVQQLLDQLKKEHKDEYEVDGRSSHFNLQALKDIHFSTTYSTFDYGEDTTSKASLLNLGIVALFLLLLGCINFINLNTAQATKRAKEIGVRKTLGSSKKQLVLQFLGETLWLTLAAVCCSLLLSYWLLHIFSDFIPQGLHFGLFAHPMMIAIIVGIVTLVVVLSGFYPAMVLSRYQPISVLKQQFSTTASKGTFRKYLTVFQFSIAQVFIIATLLVGKQMYYLMHKDMGITTEAIAYVRTPWNDNSFTKKQALEHQLEALPQIQQVTIGGSPPASNNTHSSLITFMKDDNEVKTDLQFIYGTQKYRELYGIPLLAGRDLLNDTIKEFVINETYAKTLGFKNAEDAVGSVLKYGDKEVPVVGVMKDFNQRSLHTAITPMALIGDWNREKGFSQFRSMHFQLAKGAEDWTNVLHKVEEAYTSFYPDSEVEITFIDDMVQKFYAQERKIATLLNWATALAIIISCLGLFGLVIFTTEKRVKEIGVRKILGASVLQLNLLLCKEFLILVGIAFLIAMPIAWYGLHYWLEGYAYKTDISWWIFIAAAAGMMLIALLIMSVKTIRAARTNPVNSLRTE